MTNVRIRILTLLKKIFPHIAMTKAYDYFISNTFIKTALYYNNFFHYLKEMQ